MSRPLSHGRSGNPKGRPKRKGEGLPYARILDRMVTIKDGRGARQVTAEEAFLLYLRKKALEGNEAAQERLEEIQAFRRERDPDLGPGGITTIVRVIVSQSQLCASNIENAGEALSLPTSRPDQARAMACPTRARSAWRPAPKYNGARNRRRGRSDGRTGGKHSVGGSNRRCDRVPSLLSLAEPEAAPASGKGAPRRRGQRFESLPLR